MNPLSFALSLSEVARRRRATRALFSPGPGVAGGHAPEADPTESGERDAGDEVAR